MTLWVQTLAIIKKNFLVLYRNKGDFLSEFIVPFICGMALIAFSKLYKFLYIKKKLEQIGKQFIQNYFPIFLPIGALGLSRKILVGFVAEKSERFKETQKVNKILNFFIKFTLFF